MANQTKQEEFWAGEFGNEYSDRNTIEDVVPSRTAMLSRVLAKTHSVTSVFEFGANIGINLAAIRRLLPGVELKALEINQVACEALRAYGWVDEVHLGSILTESFPGAADLCMTSGLLIHIHPEHLPRAYDALFQTARRYILICEYYNPTPISISYRGHEDRLFKRDFAGEMMDRCRDLVLLDYGFVYHRDPNFPLDDLNWFLMEKR